MAVFQRSFANETWAINQVKPTGFLSIDWSHPLTAGLEGYWFDTGLGLIVDLVNPSRTMGMQGTAPAIGTTPYGTGFLWNGSPSAFFICDARMRAITAAGPYSFASGFMPTQASPAAFAMAVCRTANNSGVAGTSPNWGFYYSGTIWRSVIPKSGGIFNEGNALTGALAANTYVGMACTVPPSATGNMFTYTQGFQDDTDPGQTLASYDTNDDIIIGGASAVAASSAYTGYAFWFGFWSRQMTAGEQLQLFEQPYVFLRGSPRMRARIVTAAGGGHHGLPIIGAG
jgi:hypothetical protein